MSLGMYFNAKIKTLEVVSNCQVIFNYINKHLKIYMN